MAESLQQLILDYLNTHGSVSDSRTITIPGATSPATDADSQIAILGALNSLLSREVYRDLSPPAPRLPVSETVFPVDDPLRVP